MPEAAPVIKIDLLIPSLPYNPQLSGGQQFNQEKLET
jgi:hypothetical protein